MFYFDNLPESLTLYHVNTKSDLVFSEYSKFKSFSFQEFKDIYEEYLTTKNVRAFFSKYRIGSAVFKRHLPSVLVHVNDECPKCGGHKYIKLIATRAELYHGETKGWYSCTSCDGILTHEKSLGWCHYEREVIHSPNNDDLPENIQPNESKSELDANESLQIENKRLLQIIEAFEAIAFDMFPIEKQKTICAMINRTISIEQVYSILGIKSW